MTRAEQRFHDLTRPTPGTTALHLVRTYASHDIQIFAEHVLEDEKAFGSITLAAIHRCLLDHVRYGWERGFGAVCLMPPASGKTQQLVGVIGFTLGNDVALREKLACAARRAADERVAVVGRLIKYNERFRSVFPTAVPGDRWADDRLVLERPRHIKDASLEGFGVTSKTQGMRADVIACDDFDDDDSMSSVRRREKTSRAYFAKFVSRRDRDTRFVLIATPWHPEDVVNGLLADETQRSLHSFLWIPSVVAGELRGRHMIVRTVLPGEHHFLRYLFKEGLGWAPQKAAFLAELRHALPPPDDDRDPVDEDAG
jgi:hypothetical protein